jgi:hypothetical protein
LHRLALAVTVGQHQDRAAGRTRREHVVVRVADHQQPVRRHAEGGRNVEQRARVRLARWEVVAADNDREERLDPRLREMRPHEARRLVGDDGQRKTHRAHALEARHHAGERARLAAEAGGVMRLVTHERIAELALIDRRRRGLRGERERPAHEIGHALADERADGVLRQYRMPEFGEQPVYRRREIVDRVEQRAVEVERNGADVEYVRSRHGSGVGRFHAAFANSTRILAIVAT